MFSFSKKVMILDQYLVFIGPKNNLYFCIKGDENIKNPRCKSCVQITNGLDYKSFYILTEENVLSHCEFRLKNNKHDFHPVKMDMVSKNIKVMQMLELPVFGFVLLGSDGKLYSSFIKNNSAVKDVQKINNFFDQRKKKIVKIIVKEDLGYIRKGVVSPGFRPIMFITSDGCVWKLEANVMKQIMLSKNQGKIIDAGFYGSFVVLLNDKGKIFSDLQTINVNYFKSEIITKIKVFPYDVFFVTNKGQVYTHGMGKPEKLFLGHGGKIFKKDIHFVSSVREKNIVDVISDGREFTLFIDKNGYMHMCGKKGNREIARPHRFNFCLYYHYKINNQGTILKQFIKYINIVRDKPLSEKEKQKLLAGACFGFSFFYAFMAHIGNLQGWRIAFDAILCWNGERNTLKNVVRIPGLTRQTGESLGMLFEKIISYTIFSQSESDIITTIVPKWGLKNNPDIKAQKLAPQQSFLKNFSEVIIGGEKKSIQDMRIIDFSSGSKIKQAITPENLQKYIVLLLGDGHGVAIRYGNCAYWCYDPNNDSGEVKFKNKNDLSSHMCFNDGYMFNWLMLISFKGKITEI